MVNPLSTMSTFSRLLLATEHGEFDAGAEQVALALAQRCGLPLRGVMPLLSNSEFEAAAPQQAAQAEGRAALLLQQLQQLAAVHRVALDMHLRRGPELFEQILLEASACAADLLITRRRGKRGFLANLLVGEMVSKVVAHAQCSVLVVPREAHLWQRRVLLAVDPETADEAGAPMLARAAQLARESALPLSVLCVARSAAERDAALATATRFSLQAREAGADASAHASVGRPHEEVLAQARALGADLLVLGRHGNTALGRAWVGGTAQKLIGLAECPALIHIEPANPVNPANPAAPGKQP